MKSVDELNALRDKARAVIGVREDRDNAVRVVVGMGTCGIVSGARAVLAALVEGVAKEGLGDDVVVSQSGCIGDCLNEPTVEIFIPGGQKTTYVMMTPERAARVVREHLIGGKPVEEFMGEYI